MQTSGSGEIQPRYVGVHDLAKYASLSPQTIRRLIKAGTIQAHKVGGRVLVDLEAFDAYVRSRRASA